MENIKRIDEQYESLAPEVFLNAKKKVLSFSCMCFRNNFIQFCTNFYEKEIVSKKKCY